MTKIKRYQPKDGDNLGDILLHQELLIMHCNMLLDFIKSLTKRSCCNVCECIACDTHKFLREIGEE